MPPKTPFDDLDGAAFEDVVTKECRGSAPEAVGRGLRTPEVAHRWYTALVRVKHSVEGQFAAKTSDVQRAHAMMLLGEIKRGEYLERVKAYQQWRAGALRFRTSIEQRIQEAHVLMGPTTRDVRLSLNLAADLGRLKEKIDMAVGILELCERDGMTAEAAVQTLRQIFIREEVGAFPG